MTLPLRRFVFWMHLIAAGLAGAVILLMSVTGVLLTYEKQMIRWAEAVSGPPTSPQQPRLSLEDVVARATTVHPGVTPGTVTLRRAVDAPVEVNFGQKGSVFVHAYTGQVLGTGAARTRAFFRSVMEWHRWLALTDARRATGKTITGVSNLIFLFILVSGFYLWWPRAWTWLQFRQVLWFRSGLSSKARDFNWHHVIGYWSLVPLVLIVWSGAVIGYPWASDLTYRLAGETPPPRPGQAGPSRPGEVRTATNAPVAAQPLAALLGRAAAQQPDWHLLSTRLPRPSEPQLQVTIDTGTGAQPQKKGTLHLDRATGATSRWEPFEAQSPGRQWRAWLRFVHTGEYYGLLGQTIAGLVTAGTVVLVWTGLALTWRRFRAWRGRTDARGRVAA